MLIGIRTLTLIYTGPFPDTNIIAHFAADTIAYDKPTTPPELNITRKKIIYTTNTLHPPPKQQHWYLRTNEPTYSHNK